MRYIYEPIYKCRAEQKNGGYNSSHKSGITSEVTTKEETQVMVIIFNVFMVQRMAPEYLVNDIVMILRSEV